MNNKRKTVFDMLSSTRSAYNIAMSDARSAVENGQNGEFNNISLYAQAMLVDPTYCAARTHRIGLLLNRKINVILDKNITNPDAIEAATIFEKNLSMMLTKDNLQRFVGWYLDTGIAVGNVFLTIDVEQKIKLPQLRTLSTANVSFDKSQEKYMFSSKDGQLEIEDHSGTWIFLTNWEPNKPAGIASSCIYSFANKQFAYSSWSDYLDGNAWPILVFNNPNMNATDDGANDAAADAYMNARGQRAMSMFGGQSVQAINTANSSDQAYSNMIDKIDTEFQKAWLAGNLIQEITQNGSYSAIKTQKGNLVDMVKSDAIAIEDVLNEQFVPLFYKMNEYYTVSRKEMIKLQFEFVESEDTDTLGTALNSFASFATSMKNSGFTVENMKEIASKFGIKLSSNKSEQLIQSTEQSVALDACSTPRKKRKINNG